ncbi:hypothetical protein [Streptomyces sp. NBC_00233]|uniref:hypothetical protein n=1 Tax=Streptomyces sp. NBC_00233 TaxID=2975686 RepID=UPI00224FEBA4|nr:hypothetical protein [Streptomyces sp. NBC_00233]MCX5233067.1 hypothetical protein [Streptomyces sp. NBC_00233]
MSLKRRLLAVTTTTAAAVALALAGPLGTAHADVTGFVKITPKLNVFIHDEDSGLDPDDTGRFFLTGVTQTLGFDPLRPIGNEKSWTFTKDAAGNPLCIDEVRAEIKVVVRLTDTHGSMVTSQTTKLFEGASCDTTDWDGFGGTDNTLTGYFNGERGLATHTVFNTAEWSAADIKNVQADYVSAQLSIVEH